MADSHSALADRAIGVSNPPFDPRRYSTNPAYRNLQQGYMVQRYHIGSPTFGSSAVGAGSGGLPWKFRFMYNPSQIAVAYNSADASQFPKNFLGEDQQAATTISSVSPSLSFSLYLDRTYEINQALGQGFSHATGVLVDIDYFEKVAGIDGIGNGPILPVPIDIFFGGVHSLHWFGTISAASVTYAQFTQDMVPMNAELDLTFQQLFPGNPPGTAQAGSGADVNHPKADGSVTNVLGATHSLTPPNQVDGPAPHPTSHLGVIPDASAVLGSPTLTQIKRGDTSAFPVRGLPNQFPPRGQGQFPPRGQGNFPPRR